MAGRAGAIRGHAGGHRITPPDPAICLCGGASYVLFVARNRQRLGYRRIVQLLVYLVIVPTVLLLLIGIVLMFIGSTFNVLFGLLTVSFVLVAVTGIVLVLVFLRREANLSELQADFVSKVSHELRTPLTGIRLFVETMMRARGDRATEDKCLEALERDTERLTQRIERLLDWGRMEAGRKLFDLRNEHLEEVFAEAVEHFEPLRERNPDLDFAVEVEPGLPVVQVDLPAMVDAIGNLLSNAIKYGGNPLRIRLCGRMTPEGVAIEVTDNGDGIPRSEHRRIFYKFYRIDDRLSREREGSGLGLSIVKHIVRAHQGRIRVESSRGKGSTFRIILPKAGTVSTAKLAAAAAEAKGT
jgi:two-component system phosphate regulon sensor histidine kinase PhoR